MNRQFTGRHMAAILIVFFGIVFAVNFTMARYASSTFGGIVVENSYVASQEFNRWLDEAESERALGWSAQAQRTADGQLAVVLDGAPAAATLSAVARHPLGHAPDRTLTFAADGQGRYLSREELPAGRWIVRMTAQAGEGVWRIEEKVS